MPSNKNKSKFSIEKEMVARITNLRDKLLKKVFNVEKKETPKIFIEEAIISKINDLKEKELNEKIIVELNAIIKDYFKTKFGLAPSLTYEEIIEKLENKRFDGAAKTNLFHLLVQINQKEYFPHSEMTSTEIKLLLNLAIKILEDIEQSERVEEEKREKELIVHSSEPLRITQLRQDIYPFIKGLKKVDWRNENVRKNYEKIREDYLKLEDDEKAEVYPQIASIFKTDNAPILNQNI